MPALEGSALSRRRLLRLLPAASLGWGAPAAEAARLAPEAAALLDRLSRACFLYFWEKADAATGLVLDRSLNSDLPEKRRVASSAATGFGLTALCIAADRQWHPRAQLLERARATLRFYAERSVHEQGWFYHFVDAGTGERVWKCELSSIDTALLLAGVLTAKQFFRDAELTRYADQIYRRIDWRWMTNGDSQGILTMGWKPESGFLRSRWDHYCELLLLYILGLGADVWPASSAKALPESCWTAWRRPQVTFGKRSYISGAPTLFTHQYSHAWLDFRGRWDRSVPQQPVDWFANSREATLAHREFCVQLGQQRFPGCYDEELWGVSASDSAKGYRGWGGPPATSDLDGTVVPCAAAGSLPFAPTECTTALLAMERRFGSRIWGRYGFVDAFHPTNGWTNPDVIGIDLGITLLAAENLRSGNVWRWFGRNPEVRRGLARARIGR